MAFLDASLAKGTLVETDEEDFASIKLDVADIIYYPDLCKISQEIVKNYPNEAIVTVSHIAYGWMPRMLSKFNEDKNLETLEKVRNSINVTNQDEGQGLILSLPPTSPVNNSWVGLSKVLHFINPEIFPIWDSKVAAKFNVSGDKLNSKECYLEYFDFVHCQKDLQIVDDFLEYLKSKGVIFSRVRVVEFLLYAM